MNFLELNLKYDHDKIYEEYLGCSLNDLQINITSDDGKTYVYPTNDPKERLKQNLNQEKYNIINSFFKNSYCETIYNELNKLYGVCRARFMVMTPEQRAYSMHFDCAPRIHIPIKTNSDCMFILEDKIYKMPNLGSAYKINTTKKHSALNLGWEDRIHLVFCIKRDEATIRKQSEII